jgi:F-type H+-transporting ATPase subunit alpha
MTELLKQDQYQPLRVEQQVAILFAGSRGLLDDVPVEKVREFEKGLHPHLAATARDLLAEIAQKKALDEDLETRLTAAIEDYKRGSGLVPVKSEAAA